jgi:hypothetical protein
VEVPLPWERLLWKGRSWPLRREHYILTDFRLVRATRAGTDDILIQDIHEIQRSETPIDRLLGTSTLVIRSHDRRVSPLALHRVRHGAQLAALLELLAGDTQAAVSADAVRAALAWEPTIGSGMYRAAFTSLFVVVTVLFTVAISLHGKISTIAYPDDDAIYPGGEKRTRAEILHFMEDVVMPWARQALGPVVGGPNRVSCATCHGTDAPFRGWQMPSVPALPAPALADRGWEIYSASMDSQTRNAIYGYVAEAGNQPKAAYMREVVMPGMANLLHRPVYDFTKPYDYNRTRLAFGCYHCHRMK